MNKNIKKKAVFLLLNLAILFAIVYLRDLPDGLVSWISHFVTGIYMGMGALYVSGFSRKKDIKELDYSKIQRHETNIQVWNTDDRIEVCLGKPNLLVFFKFLKAYVFNTCVEFIYQKPKDHE